MLRDYIDERHSKTDFTGTPGDLCADGVQS